ncbi:uncharacterized protein LOC122508287 [Leptopilina heterotoma]|uniref:uncharacterized protein LOC122508287 n=1 Tax=Leptopilina heterotoma TaxID=63436 RepID=UPI001CA95EB2|nr:uncharacterized protein LOC122508287 [Leptopilina heterotoma]
MRRMIGLILFKLTLAISYCSAGSAWHFQELGNEINKVCRTKECFSVAAELWESVNKSVDPCENFYEYACGKWTINNPIPKDKAYWNSRSKTKKKIEDRIKDLLEERIKPTDILPIKQLKKFYRSCMNLDALESNGISRLEAILANNGGWPMAMEISEWDSQEFPWQQIDKNYFKISGQSPFYQLGVSEDYRNFVTRMLLDLSSPSLPKILPKKSQEKINRTMLYESGQYGKLMTEVALMFAKDKFIDNDQLATDVQNVIKLEQTIDKELEKLEYDFNLVTVKELQKKYDDVSTSKSKINWISMINDYLAVANIEMKENQEIGINYSNLFSMIVNILENTQPRVIVNYIHWYFLKQFLPYTTQHMRMLEFNLYKEMTGVKEETPRHEECIEDVGMNHAKAYQYVKKYFTDDMREHAQEIFKRVQKAIVKHVLRADWLDDEMRKLVLQKVNKMKTNIGYPPMYNNATAMEYYYRGMAIGNQFLENIFMSLKFEQKKKVRSIGKPLKDDEDWGDTLDVNAFYNPFSNALTIPAGEFQTTFYSPTLPEIMSYGSIGFTVGHEVSHGFDVDGIEVDADGRSIPYSSDARSSLDERTNCFIDQYEEFYKDKPNENKIDEPLWKRIWNYVTLQSEWTEEAKRTQSENIADSLGLEMVYDALREIENEKNSPRLPGFEDLSNEQFFFLTYANVWCSSSRSKYEEFIYDLHSEEQYRVNAAVQNSQEFAKAFNCPENSAMNPQRKCKIWMRRMIGLILFKLTLAISYCSAGSAWHFQELGNEINKVCRTKECFRVAAELWESVNKSVDPCENFYEYACGKWTINNPIPKDKAYWDSRAKTEKKIEDRIKVLLEERIKPTDIFPVKQLKKFYRSCMNLDALESNGISRLEAILANNGGWPMAMEISEWDSQEFLWQQINKNYFKISGQSPFYELNVGQDYRNIDVLDYYSEDRKLKLMLKLSSPSLPEILPKKSQRKINRTMLYESGQYGKLMTEVALMFAKDKFIDNDQLATDVQNVIKLEQTIEKELKKLKYDLNVITVKELQRKYDDVSTSKSKINWISIISDYLASANVEMDENEEIIMSYSNLFSMIAKILEKTQPRVIVNYVHWYFLKQFLPYTTQHMRMLEFNLYKEMTGVKEETPRHEECVKEVGMYHVKAYQFVKKYFTDNMREHAQEIFKGVQKAIVKHILRADWLDDEMRKSVLQKVNKMKTNIGYPSIYNKDTVMEYYYRGMAIGNQFLENIFSSLKFEEKKKIRLIRNNTLKEDPELWGDTLEVNAFYNPLANALTIPAGEFQTTFYSPTLPEVMSYGSIGFTVGHEVSHGFDVNGIEFDANGKKIRYSYNARSGFKERANCFVDQYEEFYKNKPNENKKDEPIWIKIWNYVTFQTEWTEDAKLKQGENIADSLGLEMVYDALREIENEKNSPRLPGFEDLSNEQFFFLTYANVWCSSSRSKYDEFIGDVHSEDQYRVNAAVQNSQEFAKAFNCPENSAMNPQRKCKIW